MVRQLVRQLVCNIVITNNHATFYLRQKNSLAKIQNISNYYDRDCRIIATSKMELFVALVSGFTKNSILGVTGVVDSLSGIL